MAAVSGLMQYSLRKVPPQGKCFNASHFSQARIYWNTPVCNKNLSELLSLCSLRTIEGHFGGLNPVRVKCQQRARWC